MTFCEKTDFDFNFYLYDKIQNWAYFCMTKFKKARIMYDKIQKWNYV